jgi:hypothetical protein
MTAQTHGSPTRAPRPLEGSLLHLDAAMTISRLRGEAAFRTDGRNSMTVVSDGPTRVIVTVVDAGREVGGERSDGHVSIVLLEGRGILVRGDSEAALTPGSLAVLAPGSAWSLRAEQPSAFVASFWQPV